MNSLIALLNQWERHSYLIMSHHQMERNLQNPPYKKSKRNKALLANIFDPFSCVWSQEVILAFLALLRWRNFRFLESSAYCLVISHLISHLREKRIGWLVLLRGCFLLTKLLLEVLNEWLSLVIYALLNIIFGCGYLLFYYHLIPAYFLIHWNSIIVSWVKNLFCGELINYSWERIQTAFTGLDIKAVIVFNSQI